MFLVRGSCYESLQGVDEVESGYMGGQMKDPTIGQSVPARPGHAEVVRIRFNPQIINFETLLEWFWRSHDPTTLNRQGADVGTQYRSAIFYRTETQQKIAEDSKNAAQSILKTRLLRKSLRQRFSIRRKKNIRAITKRTVQLRIASLSYAQS